MRIRMEGTLTKWNDGRGFGFIAPTRGGPEVFVHISAFPNDGVRPTLGEKLTFEIETDKDGKKRAKHLSCPERPSVRRAPPASFRRHASYRRKERTGFFARIIPLLVVLGLIVYGYGEYSRRALSLTENAVKPAILAPAQIYRCDGRTHCSHMRSCDEATFFLRNCPGVKMDGDHDGVPCEQQWCTR